MKHFLAFGLLFLLCFSSHAQLNRYIIYLKHKGATTHTLNNPAAFLTQRAIDRRTRYAIAVDSADLPVPASFISQIQGIPNVTVLNVSRWLNAIAIQTTDANAIHSINALPFVQTTTAIASRAAGKLPDKTEEEINPPSSANRFQEEQADYFNYGTNSFNEIHLHNGEFLHNMGLRGQGMHITMLDVGYLNYTTLDAMDSIITNGQVLSTWDFVNREASVVEDGDHGMKCLSIIAANIPGQFIGKAPKASFHLFKTEDVASEYPIEEFNWVCGAERADSNGSDIISSSLGYTTFDAASLSYSYNDLNGDIAMSTRGADIAASKGLLVFNAVGNYGAGPWHYLAAPADADSAVAVGAVSFQGNIWPSSSFGPSFDGRIKPDIASIGLAAMIQNPNNTVGFGNGTSFACPNMAGLGTCLWQGFPEFNNMRIVRAIREAGSIFNSPDDRIGYGIPDMKTAFSVLLSEYAASSVAVTTCTATLNWNSKDVAAMRYEIERKAPGETNFTKVADVAAQAGDLLANHSYQHNNTLVNTTTGTLSYRIRQIIDTAAATFTAVYIDTATIALTEACTTTATNDPDAGETIVFVSPNPSPREATLIVYTRNAIPTMPVLIYNTKGQLISQLSSSKGPGKATIALPVNVLSKGSYYIKIYDRLKLIGSAKFLRL